MLVRFDSNIAGELLMFSDVAQRLLKTAGKDCTARGVITVEQIPDIVIRLREAIASEESKTDTENPNEEEEEEEEEEEDEDKSVVSFNRRAQPFIEFLERTAKDREGVVLWEAARDFNE